MAYSFPSLAVKAYYMWQTYEVFKFGFLDFRTIRNHVKPFFVEMWGILTKLMICMSLARELLFKELKDSSVIKGI